jgi:hypothetical protein
VFFMVRVAGGAVLTTEGWTDVERKFVDRLQWWELPALARVEEEVFPHGLADLVAALVAGWDGVPRHLADGP